MKDLGLVILGAILGWATSHYFYKKQETQIACYALSESGKCSHFYFEYKNGFNRKRYTRRGISDDHELDISESEFLLVKNRLARRSIP